MAEQMAHLVGHRQAEHVPVFFLGCPRRPSPSGKGDRALRVGASRCFEVVRPERGVERYPAVGRGAQAGSQGAVGEDRDLTTAGHRAPVALRDGGCKHHRIGAGELGGRDPSGRGVPVRGARGVRMARPAAVSAGRRGQEKRRCEDDSEEETGHTYMLGRAAASLFLSRG